MRGSDKIIKATVVSKWGYLAVDVPKNLLPKQATNHTLRIINRVDDLIFEGDVVEGYAFEFNRSAHNFNFFVTRNVTRSLDKKEFIRLVNHIVVDRVNEEMDLFGRNKRHIEYETLTDKKRFRELVICRYIAIGIIVEYLNRQVSDEYLAKLYNMDRCTVIHASEQLKTYGFDSQLNGIIKDIKIKVDELYEALKQPHKIDVFEFMEQ